ncbi:MAG: RNA-binding protein [Thermoprotei archaeon]|nr:MAG: RNA-binding protein [Thermoprotei archaeon]
MSKKDKKKIASSIREQLGERVASLVLESKKVEAARLRHKDVENVIIIDDVPAFFIYKEEIYPTLLLIYKLGFVPELPKVFVDAGAVPHILNGADVMVPGITKIEGSFSENDKVLVVEEEKQRIFAVGKALMSSEHIATSRKGKAIKNIHYAGDELWEIFLNI